jgi:hypothetical protein
MRIDPRNVSYLTLAAGEAQLREEWIPQLGEKIAAVATPFALLPSLESMRLVSPAPGS